MQVNFCSVPNNEWTCVPVSDEAYGWIPCKAYAQGLRKAQTTKLVQMETAM